MRHKVRNVSFKGFTCPVFKFVDCNHRCCNHILFRIDEFNTNRYVSFAISKLFQQTSISYVNFGRCDCLKLWYENNLQKLYSDGMALSGRGMSGFALALQITQQNSSTYYTYIVSGRVSTHANIQLS
ncbi:Hypothetical_protein [Hexamita inflata]|uniref:Hypothetical_protein n=1 Tax=Hexamita inflata TaxID=28002 RepID=A0AA86U6J5_9EUKA|nr:Hypothetical protein HINF_LOCUS32445 [Hexamita inflata]